MSADPALTGPVVCLRVPVTAATCRPSPALTTVTGHRLQGR